MAFVWSGLYDISATDQHLAPTYHLIKKTMERSVERRAADIRVPALGAPEQLSRGVALFREHCVQCHGGPGVAPEPFSLGLTPLATPLARSGKDRSPAYLYWVLKEGIKMTGMPAWKYRLDEEELWSVVAFLKVLPLLSPQAYGAMQAQAVRAGVRRRHWPCWWRRARHSTNTSSSIPTISSHGSRSMRSSIRTIWKLR